MIDSKQRTVLYIFIIFSSIGACLYIGFFSFYLIKIDTSPVIISALIGATALSSLFWGPIAGRMIDRTKNKFLWFLYGQIGCGAFVFCFGNLHQFNPIWTTILVLGFSLILNLTVIIINQYLIALLHDDYEISVARVSRVTGMAVFFSGLVLAALYDRYSPFWFFTASACCYLLSATTLFFFFRGEIRPNDEVADGTFQEKGVSGIYRQTFRLIRKHWFLALSMCILAFTETSFNTNFDVIAFSLGTTPFAIIFLLGALSGALDSCASWVYPKLVGKTRLVFRWYFFLIAFFIIFAVAALLSFWGIHNRNPWFLPVLSVALEFFGIWWAIFIAARVRETSDKNTYGQTMAAFRVPRSLVTFFGITSIGTALQSGNLWWILLLNTLLLGILLCIYVYRQATGQSTPPAIAQKCDVTRN